MGCSESEVLIKVQQAFAENGIEILFPQRDINIKDVSSLLNNEKTPEEGAAKNNLLPHNENGSTSVRRNNC